MSPSNLEIVSVCGHHDDPLAVTINGNNIHYLCFIELCLVFYTLSVSGLTCPYLSDVIY